MVRLLSTTLIAALVLVRFTERRLVKRLQRAGAQSEATAAPLPTRHLLAAWQLQRLSRAGVIRSEPSAPDRFYLDETALHGARQRRRQRGMQALAAAIPLGIGLFILLREQSLSPQLRSALGKAALPTLEIAALALVARVRRLSWREDFRLAIPTARALLGWLALWSIWMLGTNQLLYWRGPWDFSPWLELPILVAVLRVVSVGVLGPIAEELIFRGYLYHRLFRTRLGPAGTVVLLAAGWAVFHYFYSPQVVTLIFGNGLLLGAARVRSGSVVVPIAMHMVWNLYAIW